MMLRAIVVGSGWGRNAARTLESDDRVSVAGIVGRGSVRTQALADELRVAVFRSVEEALSAVSPHVAVLAVDEEHNERFARVLVAAGCHVLCAHPVASSGRAVRDLAALARSHGVVVATDYSLRACAEHRAALEVLASSGALLRVGVEFPGRGLPMAVDLAASFAGPAERVFATRAYPEALRERLATTPEAFAPTVVIEHTGGTVSQLMPIPHARANEAYRAVLSTEAARIDVRLPAGGATRVSSLREGRARESSLIPSTVTADPTAGYRDAVAGIVRNFVDAAVGRTALIAPLEVEIVVRDVWAAIRASLRAREPVQVASS